MLTAYPAHVLGHRQRLRERFNANPIESLHVYEVLELLLTFCVPRKDVKPIAKNLIERFGSLAGVLDASREELHEVPDVGPASSTLIKLAKEIGGLYLRERMTRRDLVSSPRAVVDFASIKLGGLPHEAFMVIFLNVQNEAIHHAIVNEGTVDQVAVYPRRIVELALKFHAAGLILAHNHPSGHAEPSDEDRRLTTALRDAARLLDIRVLDHIVIGKGHYVSFVERGWIA